MGGRKTYTLDVVVGKTAENARARERLIASVDSKDPRTIVSSALDLALKSEKLVHNLAEAVQAIDFVRANADAPALDYEGRKRLASKYWTERKKETGTPSDSVVDRLLVDSLTKFIRRGKRK
jgi:hypothetical protein